MREYTIILDPNPDECVYTVTVPALPGCITQRKDVEECTARAKETFATYIAAAVAHGDHIPEATRPPVVTISMAR